MLWGGTKNSLTAGLQSPSFHVSLRATSIMGTIEDKHGKSNLLSQLSLCTISPERETAVVLQLYPCCIEGNSFDHLLTTRSLHNMQQQHMNPVVYPNTEFQKLLLLAKPFINSLNIQLVLSNTKVQVNFMFDKIHRHCKKKTELSAFTLWDFGNCKFDNFQGSLSSCQSGINSLL